MEYHENNIPGEDVRNWGKADQRLLKSGSFKKCGAEILGLMKRAAWEHEGLQRIIYDVEREVNKVGAISVKSNERYMGRKSGKPLVEKMYTMQIPEVDSYFAAYDWHIHLHSGIGIFSTSVPFTKQEKSR